MAEEYEGVQKGRRQQEPQGKAKPNCEYVSPAGKFFDGLWKSLERETAVEAATEDLTPQQEEQAKMVSRFSGDWAEMTRRVLTESGQSGESGVSFRETGIDRERRTIGVQHVGEGRLRVEPLELKHSNLRVTVDLKPEGSTHFPTDPDNPRPQLEISAREMFSDTRRAVQAHLEGLVTEYKEQGTGRLDETTHIRREKLLRQAVLLTQQPDTELELTGKVVHYNQDTGKIEKRNLSGAQITRRVSGKTETRRLPKYRSPHLTAELPSQEPSAEVMGEVDRNLGKLKGVIDRLVGRG